MHRAFVSLSLVVVGLVGCAPPASPGPQIAVENPWARPTIGLTVGGGAMPPMPGMPAMAADQLDSAAYLVVVNRGNQPDSLIRASSDAAGQIEFHETQMQGDIAQMAPISHVDVPANGRVQFSPGGYHLMLENLNRDLRVGDTITLTLQFEKSGAITVVVPVENE